ncbi:hypothetical protein LTR22_014627 [Elasticomyces elasticus]|nr:hypothetical protein LTR22_014627 [Elasticomyces elasticus]KAK4928794.1 hypothetical protein LTR49_004603 [Elasticomyces elasticus]
MPASFATSDTLQLMSMYSMLGIFLEAQNRAHSSRGFDAAAAGPHGVRPMQPVELTPSSDTSAPSLAQTHLPGTNPAGVLVRPNTIKASESRTDTSDSLRRESAAPAVEHDKKASLIAKVRDALQGETKISKMDCIVNPICTSRAYSCLELAQWDRDLLESIAHAESNETSGHNDPYIVLAALHERLDGVLKHAEEYADLKLLADVLWRCIAITPCQQADNLLRIQSLWEEGGQPLECIKLLVYSSGRFEPHTSTVEFLLRIDNSVFRTSHIPHGAVGVTKGNSVPTFSTRRTLYQLLNQHWQQRLMMSVQGGVTVIDFPGMVAQLFAGEPPHLVDQDLLALGPLERHRAFTPAEGADPLHIDDSLRPPTDLPTERSTGAGGTSGWDATQDRRLLLAILKTTDVKSNATALAGVMAATGWSPNSISITRHLQQLKRHAATESSEVDRESTESNMPNKKPKAPPSKRRKVSKSYDPENPGDADDEFM